MFSIRDVIVCFYTIRDLIVFSYTIWDVIVFFYTIRDCSERKELAPRGSKFFPFRDVPILKKDTIDENHYSFQ